MAISLYEASVGSYLQTLDAVSGFLDKGLAHCREHDVDPEAIVEACIIADMRPFRFQVTSAVHHSLGAIEGIRSGTFRPPSDRRPYDYVGLQTLITNAREALRKLAPAEIDGRADADVILEIGDLKRLFTTEGFVLTFSLPNFHFHATTAYDILRAKGVPLGKRDYVGAPRLKG